MRNYKPYKEYADYLYLSSKLDTSEDQWTLMYFLEALDKLDLL